MSGDKGRDRMVQDAARALVALTPRRQLAMF